MNDLLTCGAYSHELDAHLSPSFLLARRSAFSAYFEVSNRTMRLLKILDSKDLMQSFSLSVRSQLDALHCSYRGLLSRLDSNNTSVHRSDLLKTSLKNQLLAIEGFPPSYFTPMARSPFEKYLSAMQKASRKRALCDRLYLQMHEAHVAGWYMVFETLTYDPHAPDASDALMFGQSWRKHVDQVRRSVAMRLYDDWHSPEGVSTGDYCHYCAVPELHKDGRVHLHVLWFLKELPFQASYVDPNTCTVTPYRREINGWPKSDVGFSTPLAVRYGDDAFTKKGWKWPVDKLTGSAIPCKEHYAVAVYVSKYLDKPRPEALCHKKTRISQGLGLQTLRQRIHQMSPLALYHLLCPGKKLSLFGRSISPLLRRMTISRELSIRFLESLKLKLMPISKRKCVSFMGRHVLPPALFKRPSISTLPTVLFNQLNSILFRILNMKEMVISDEIDQFFPDELSQPGFGHLGKFKPLSYARL